MKRSRRLQIDKGLGADRASRTAEGPRMTKSPPVAKSQRMTEGARVAKSPRTAKGPQLAKVVAAVAVAGIALAGCTGSEPGAAAVVGDVSISQATIGEQTRALNQTLGQPADTAAPAVTRGIVTHGVTGELIDATASRLGIVVTDEEIEEAYSVELERMGGEEPLLAAAAQAFVPPEQVRDFLGMRLMFSALAQGLSPTGSPESQTELALVELAKTGAELGVSVAPRYGEWSMVQMQIVPPADPVSIPEAPPESPLGQLIPQP